LTFSLSAIIQVVCFPISIKVDETRECGYILFDVQLKGHLHGLRLQLGYGQRVAFEGPCAGRSSDDAILQVPVLGIISAIGLKMGADGFDMQTVLPIGAIGLYYFVLNIDLHIKVPPFAYERFGQGAFGHLAKGDEGGEAEKEKYPLFHEKWLFDKINISRLESIGKNLPNPTGI